MNIDDLYALMNLLNEFINKYNKIDNETDEIWDDFTSVKFEIQEEIDNLEA